MSLIILIVIVLIVTALAIYAIDLVGIDSRFASLIKVLVILIAILFIVSRAGLL